jgi:hypothetical protein
VRLNVSDQRPLASQLPETSRTDETRMALAPAPIEDEPAVP